MIRFLKPLAVLASLALLVSAATLPTARAADATSNVKGTLVDASGAAFTGAAEVNLYTYQEGKPTGKPTPIQTVSITADDKGAYTFKAVPAGKYSVMASSKELKVRGRTTAAVDVEAGKDVTVDPITMKGRKPKN